MIKAVFIGMSVLMIALYLLKITDVSRLLLALFCLFNMVLLGISKSIIYRVLTTYRRRGVGSKQRAKDIIDLIRANSYSGLRVTGCLDVDENAIGREVAEGVKVVGLLKDLRELLLKQVVDEIIFAMPLSKIQEPQQYMLMAK
jgi:FlaA1/EpsC-like NDP-sugar epimerase